MSTLHDWTIPGALGKDITGTTHRVEGTPRGVFLMAHGFMGYKDYGFLPLMAERLAAESFIVHRFNFSHSGMTHGHGAFDPELFGANTWTRQVDDVLAIMSSIRSGDLEGQERPVIFFGHSRGGVAMILAAGRWFDDERLEMLRGLITVASPATCNRMTPAEREAFHRDGYIEVTSSRTGQVLRIDAGWLREQQADPEGHDLATQAGRIRVPVGIIHGIDDATIPPEEAALVAEAVGERAIMRLIVDANHVFNTPNPSSASDPPSPQLLELEEVVVNLSARWK